MKIALIDLVHSTRGVSSHTTVPLGIGLLAVYLKKNIPNDQLDIRLFRNTEDILDVFKSNLWIPDVVGISRYSWNSHLDLYFAKMAKKYNPNCLIVAGGPNTEITVENRKEYLLKNDFVDLSVAYDGEIPFLDIIKRFMGGETIKDLKRNPPIGSHCLHQDTLEYIESKSPAPRLPSINVFGAVYSSGIFDKFLDADYYPLLETARGCPFTCAYCYASNIYHSKLFFLSPDIFRQEMEYLGKRFANRPEIILHIVNANMGMFEEDMAMAEIIRETQKNYNWPVYLNLNTGKDPKKLLRMLSIVDFDPGIALQTLTPEVLKNIGRMNIPLSDYTDFQKKVLYQRGKTSATELILSLPGETKETFLNTLKQVINSGVQSIVVYTLMRLTGTPLASEECAKKYQHVIRHRVVPRQFSEIEGDKIFDTEEVIVGTKEMPFDDYLYLRGLCFVVDVFFSTAELIPLKKLLLELNVDLFEWVLNIHKHIKDFSNILLQYDNFIKETKEELFESREELLEFYEKDENFSALIRGEKGDNLLRKYKHKLLSENFSSYLTLANQEAGKLLASSENGEESVQMLKDLKEVLVHRDLSSLQIQDDMEFSKKVHLTYNVPEWLHSSSGSLTNLSNLKGSFDYNLSFTEGQKRLLKKLNDSCRNSDLFWQVAYRDGYTKDLWPIWKLESNKQ